MLTRIIKKHNQPYSLVIETNFWSVSSHKKNDLKLFNKICSVEAVATLILMAGCQ